MTQILFHDLFCLVRLKGYAWLFWDLRIQHNISFFKLWVFYMDSKMLSTLSQDICVLHMSNCYHCVYTHNALAFSALLVNSRAQNATSRRPSMHRQNYVQAGWKNIGCKWTNTQDYLTGNSQAHLEYGSTAWATLADSAETNLKTTSFRTNHCPSLHKLLSPLQQTS